MSRTIREGTTPLCLASGVLSGRKLSPSTHPVASHFGFFPCATGALPAVVLVLKPRQCDKSMVGPLWGYSWESCSFFHRFSPHCFLQPEVVGTHLIGTGTLGWVVWCGAGIPCFRGITPDINPPHVGVAPPVPHLQTSQRLSASQHLSVSPTLLPVWMNVASLIPWLSNFHIARFSDNSGWYLLYSWVVIFAVVVWSVKPCLPTLASWLEVLWPSILITFTLAMTPNV